MWDLGQNGPCKVFQTRKRYSPWLSQATKLIISERDKALEVARQTQRNKDWNKFKSLRNTVNNKLKKEKINWQKEKLNTCRTDSGVTWKNILGWLDWSSVITPSQLFYDGKLENRPSRVADIMNNYFINKVKRIIESLPQQIVDPLSLLKKL